ncbi:MAG: SRPBCC domain-containing protein [Bacteroidia bacterium]
MDAINIAAIIEADRRKVWDYYTQAEHITGWNFADPSWHCPAALSDLRPGGRYFARMEARDGSFGFDFEATFTEVVEHECLAYTFGGRTARVEFRDVEQGTEVGVTFDPEEENPVELQKSGWQSIINQFKSYTEAN